MTSVTTGWHYPSSVSQTNGAYSTGKYYRQFSNLNNLKTNSNTAKCGNIGGKNGTYPRPATIIAKNYGFNIPSYADITKVEVQIKHKKTTYSSETAYPSIGGPKVALYNVNDPGATCAAPSKTLSATTATFQITPTVSSVNNSAFGVQLNYPANTNTNPGDVYLQYIAVRVTYSVPRYSLAVSRTDNVSKEVQDTLDLKLTVNNLDKTSYSPTITATLPSGVTFNKKVSGSGTISNSGQTVTWKPSLSKTTSSVTCIVRVNLTTEGSKTVSLSTTVASRTDPNASSVTYNANVTFNVSAQSVSVSIDDEELNVEDILNENEISANLIIPTRIRKNHAVSLTFDVKSKRPFVNTDSFIIEVSNRNILQVNDLTATNGSTPISSTPNNPSSTWKKYWVIPDVNNEESSDTISFNLNGVAVGQSELSLIYNDITLVSKTVIVIDDSELSYSMIEVTGETLHRMGSSLNYTATSFLRVNVDEGYEEQFSDLGGNFRFGLFNLEIGDDVVDQEEYILDNAVWSKDIPELIGEFSEVNLTFDYQEGCPLYFIFTCDYLSATYEHTSLDFTNPVIIETNERKSLEKVGTFPIPIKNLIGSESISQLEIPTTSNMNILRCYDFPVSEILDGEESIVQGVKLKIPIDDISGECSVFARLVSPRMVNGNPLIGERSIILRPIDTDGLTLDYDYSIEMGGEFDLWGLDYLDFADLQQFYLDIQIFNRTGSPVYLSMKELTLEVYYIQFEESKYQMNVNGKDTRWYGMFIHDADIPFGLETNTEYLENSGTDANIAYRMNIDKKEISVKFRVFGCTIEETTKYMERIAKLFTNKRDVLNRPITNKVKFAHIPDKHVNVIMETAIDADVEFADYDAELKLVVPEGTFFNDNPTMTSTVGTNNSIAKVTPLIQLTPRASSISITEEETNQNMSISEGTITVTNADGITSTKSIVFSENQVIQIDCSNREAILLYLEGKSSDSIVAEEYPHDDISELVSWNSDWFIIHDEYKFTSTGCEIDFIEFYERW